MKINFNESDAHKIVHSIQEALGGRELGKMVSFDLKGNQLKVTISKMGSSVLTFTGTQDSSSCWMYQLSEEKIAFTHRPFKDDVLAKIKKVIESCGGSIS